MSGHLALVGPTASGKSALALALAGSRSDIEIISADSMQVYRGMDIGTAKPTPEERAQVRHHLIDVADPHEEYTVARFQSDARRALDEIESRGAMALLVGGTGLYVQAVVDDLEIPGQFPEVRERLEQRGDTEGLHAELAELDPVAASRMDPSNRRRVVRALEVTLGSGRPFSSYGPGLDAYGPTGWRIVGLEMERDELDRRIIERYHSQIADGFVEEVARLLGSPEGLSRTARQALGYKEIADHLEGRCSLEEAVDVAVTRTKRFARRQQRWFRRDPRIIWADPGDTGRLFD